MNQYEVQEYLQHYGILGMKWGIRRDQSAARAARRDAADLKKHGYTKEAAALEKNAQALEKRIKENQDKEWEKKAFNKKTYVKVWNKTADDLNSDGPNSIAAMNKKFKGKDLNDQKVYNKYLAEHKKNFETLANKHLADELGGTTKSPSGTRSIKAVSDKDTGWMYFSAVDETKHSDDFFNNLVLKLIFDENKFIVGVEFVDLSMQQDGFIKPELNDTVLEHYGILGMKWGVRRSPRQISADHASVAALKKKKISELSDAELKKVANRLQLEKQYKQLNPSAIAKGTSAVSGIIKGPLKGVTNTIIQTAIKEYGKTIVTYAIDYAKNKG